MSLPFNFAKKAPKERISVGLDIGTSSIKVVKLKNLKDKYQLLSFNSEPMQSNVEEILKRILPVDSRQVNIAVSGQAVIIRYVNFPRMQLSELKQALKFEVQKYIPYSSAEVNIDSAILKTDLPDNKMLVLLAAIKKDYIAQRLKALEAVGVSVNIVDVDSLCLINAFNFNYADDEKIKHKTIALLNIGASQSNLNILEDGMPRLSRDISIAGNNFTQRLSDSLEVDLRAAEVTKLNPDKEKQEKITQSLEPVLMNLANEIRVSFDYYESQGASSVAKIFLGGGGSLMPQLKEKISGLLDIEVEAWNPFKNIHIPSEIDAQKLGAESGRLAVAAGLALR